MQSLIGLALVGRALAQIGSHQTLAGYRSASDVVPHSMIDLDMEELAHFVGNHDAEVTCDKSYMEDKGFCYYGGQGTCNTDEASCSTPYWYPPGFLNEGCCLCEAGCDHSKETGTSCTYYDSPAETCKYTATVDPFAGPTGYFKFAECGDVANPVIVMKRGVTYTFDQSDNSNWYHPLGFAYFVDGAHNEVDELEPGIAQTGGSTTCAAGNTCQAPMYYKNGEFAGTTYDNTAATPVGGDDFGLDNYEPEFFIPKGDWLATKYKVELTITDTAYATDMFYFCHIHAGMSGYIKIADASGTVVSTTGTGDALIASDYHKTPSTYDLSCGTYGLDDYKVGGAKECASEDFFCGGVGSLASGSFGDCLHAMDCAMDYNMRTTLDATSDATSFMHQMIPHHNNAINMAKLLMKKDTTLAADGEVMDMLWDIINVQGMQIQAMQGWLSEGKYALSSSCPALASGAGHVAPTLLAAGLAAAALLAA